MGSTFLLSLICNNFRNVYIFYGITFSIIIASLFIRRYYSLGIFSSFYFDVHHIYILCQLKAIVTVLLTTFLLLNRLVPTNIWPLGSTAILYFCLYFILRLAYHKNIDISNNFRYQILYTNVFSYNNIYDDVNILCF